MAATRRRVLLVLLLAIATIGCGSSSSTSTGPSPVKCLVTLEAPPSSIEAAGGKEAVNVTAQPECGWTASSSAAWITGLTPVSGQGNGRVEFQAAANPAGTVREGDISVNDQRVQVQQRPAACRFEVSPSTQTIGATGGTTNLSVATLAGCDWQASSDAGWVSVMTTSGTASGSVALRVAPNGGETRSAALVVAGQTVTLTQLSSTAPPAPPVPPDPPNPPNPPGCVFSLDRPSEAAPAGAGSFTVAVTGTAGCAWTATSQASWITVTSQASGSGNGTVSFTVGANSGAARTGGLTIAGRPFTVTQAAAAAPACTYSVSSGSLSIGAAGGAGEAITVSTSAGCAWTATSQASWITVSQASGSGNGTVSFTVGANSGAARSGGLTVAGRSFTVTQAAAAAPPCTYSISPTELSINEKGGGSSVAVSAGAGCGWTASSNDSWLSITQGASGSGNGTVRFEVGSTGGKKRTGTLTIAGRTFTVQQSKKDGD